MAKSNKYQITEKDIDSTITFLKATDPEHATPELAIELLEYLHVTFHEMSHEDPSKLTALYEEFKKQKKLSLN